MNKMLLRPPCSSCCQVLSQLHFWNSFWCIGMMDRGCTNLTGTGGSGSKFPVPPFPTPKQCKQDTWCLLFHPNPGLLLCLLEGLECRHRQDLAGPEHSWLLALLHTSKAQQTSTHPEENTPPFTPLACPSQSLPAHSDSRIG